MVRFVAFALLVASLTGADCKKSRPTERAEDSNPPAADRGDPGAPPPAAPKAPAEERAPFFPYEAPDGWFKVSFPWGTPGVNTRTQNVAPYGQVTDTVYEVRVGSKSAAVYVADWSAPHLKNADLEQVAAGGSHAVAQAFGGFVGEANRKAYGTNVIRDATILFHGRVNQGPAYFRYLIHGRRMYTLAILVDRGTVPVADRDQFFNSFKILK